MKHRFFISHYSQDKEIADLFSEALKRITLEQISTWHSTESSNNGLMPGIWFNQILSKISESQAVIALLTPNSINRPWVYFESGMGQALQNCEVIPICFKIKKHDILPPLGLYQCFQLDEISSTEDFFTKILNLFEIKFDKEMCRPIIQKMVEDISNVTFKVEIAKNRTSHIYGPKSTAEEFVTKNNIKGRLANLLIDNFEDTDVFMEDLKPRDFLTMRNCGPKTAKEFFDIRGF
jgi:hypothetical protein